MTAPSTRPDFSAFTRQFVEDARDRLKSIGELLLRLEVQPAAREVLDDAFREAHNLKGSAQMLGFIDIAQMAHQLEDLFVTAKRDTQIVDARAFDLVFRTIDLMSARVEELASGLVAPAADAADPDGEPAAEGQNRIEPAPARRRAPVASLRVAIDKLESLAHLAPEMIIQRLKASERHAELRRVESSLGHLRDRIREERLAPATRGRDAELGDYADAIDAINRRLRSLVLNVGDDQARLSLITEELRQHVIELTMLPIATVFNSLPRAVRDLARSFGKEVELTMIGGETAVDKRVIEHITDPLVHLVRNAIDHGIQLPAERRAAGKRGPGKLAIAAEQRGSRVHLTVSDDGRGIDPSVIRAAAVRKGLASETDVAGWTDTRLLNLIFEPGFSTRTETTDVSGRGIGMDVVRVVADRLGGSVSVESDVGRGTTVSLDLPLSLALLRVVLVDVHDDLLAIPTAPIRRILHLLPDTVIDSPAGRVIDLDGETIPIAALSSLLNLPARVATGGELTALIIETRGARVAITVDGVREEQELVFQELRGPLQNQPTMAGAAILGDGDIVPILDIQALSELAAVSTGLSPGVSRPARVPVALRRVLVVEDSVVAGDMLTEMLVGAGYDAAIAHHGLEALEALQQHSCDLVISDVDMPEMDGFELARRLRADPQLRAIPLIMVTSRESEDYRQRGLAAGADAYVTKRGFDHQQVLETVRRLIALGRDGGVTVAEAPHDHV